MAIYRVTRTWVVAADSITDAITRTQNTQHIKTEAKRISSGASQTESLEFDTLPVGAGKVSKIAKNKDQDKTMADIIEPLRSRFVEPFKTPTGDPFVLLGYWANYAAAVHEMMQSVTGKPINWSRPGSGPKFLEASLKRNSTRILMIVRRYSEIGL